MAVGCVKMKLNVSFPATSCQKLIEVDDEHKLRMFCEKPMATEVAADALGEEWKGCMAVNGSALGGQKRTLDPLELELLTGG
ncbi:small ribosomal subunit protein eS6-like isoform X2 [Peromyscus eremicus]|nr:small ribosomal subunit protein eS6-like isoform X2 [Peromyscus eremicus]